VGVVRWLGIHRFRLRDDQGQSLIDHGGIWLLELNKVTVQVVETDQQRWLKFFVEGDRLDDEHLPAWMNTEEMQQAMNTLKAFSEKTRAYHRYQARQNYLRQQQSIQNHMNLLLAEQAQAEKEQAQAEKEQAQAEKEQAQAEKEQAQAEKEQAQAEKEQAQAEKEQAQAEKEQAQAEKEQAQAEKEQAQAEKEQAQAEKEQAQAEKEQAQAEKEQAQAEKEAALAEIERLKALLRN
jgi:hypothetical protein